MALSVIKNNYGSYVLNLYNFCEINTKPKNGTFYGLSFKSIIRNGGWGHPPLTLIGGCPHPAKSPIIFNPKN
jgi:hypothetical protein